jgi:hypothetical protein
MRKILLLVAAVVLMASPAHADRRYGENHERGYGYHDYDRHEHEYHGWFFVIPLLPPPQPDPICQDFTTSRLVYDSRGNQYIVTEEHTECLDAHGQWRIVR